MNSRPNSYEGGWRGVPHLLGQLHDGGKYAHVEAVARGGAHAGDVFQCQEGMLVPCRAQLHHSLYKRYHALHTVTLVVQNPSANRFKGC
jgi:hypothetical protein